MHKNLSQSPRILVGDPRLTIARSTEGWWAKLVNAGHAFSPSSLTLCTLLIPFWNKYPFPKFSRSNLTLCLGKPSFKKSAVFLNIVQKAFDPPPFIWTFVLFCRGCFLTMLKRIWNICSSPHLKCCINVGVREAPCKKSFGILASYWTPPKIK